MDIDDFKFFVKMHYKKCNITNGCCFNCKKKCNYKKGELHFPDIKNKIDYVYQFCKRCFKKTKEMERKATLHNLKIRSEK